MRKVPVSERFWTKVAKSNEGCWIWTAKLNPAKYGGHGQVRVGQTMVGAHRIAWVLTHGPIPPKLNVLHRCNVAACVRPDHLYLGTQRENTRDAIANGTYHRWVGAAHPRAKLTDDDVRAIRSRHANGVKYRDLATEYGVTYGLIGHIVRRLVWKHVL